VSDEGAEPSEHGALVEAQRRVPRAVIGLASAWQFHGVTSEAPHEVWILIATRASRSDYPRLHVVRASGAALSLGVETHKLEAVNVRITSSAKTVADCFRYRGRIGLETALEALRACLARPKRGAAVKALVKAGEADRVLSVVRPYLEALVGTRIAGARRRASARNSIDSPVRGATTCNSCSRATPTNARWRDGHFLGACGSL